MKIVADENIPFVAECFSSIGQVIAVSGREITPGVVADADVLLVRSITRVDSSLLAGSKVRFVGTATIGCDHIDTEYLSCRNIGFASAPGSNANSAAEYVIAALLEIADKYNINLEDKSIGIIGVGNVGSRVAKKAAALGMKLYLNDPPLQRTVAASSSAWRWPSPSLRDEAATQVEYLPIEELFDCDFITLHTPLTFEGIDKTFHLADERFFKSLKPDSVFINTSRGGVVESSALKAAIRTGRFKAVVLDVWENEPSIDTELLQMVDIGTPHIAGYSLDGKVAGMIMIYNELCKYFELEPKFSVKDFLPEPAVPELKINPHSDSEQDVLLEIVKKIYNISEDDRKLRRILKEKAEKRGEFFDNLRKNYPVRREFQNTKVIVDSKNSSLAKKLEGIGFLLSQE
ncbi:MAG: 4-phosphoerythronate dehydrogenase [Sedimentisphaerales bacterium]